MNGQEQLEAWGFQDPDMVGQSEYFAIYDTLLDALNNREPEEDGKDLAEAVLDQFVESAESMKRQMMGVIQ